jgi:hypothetical protein
MPDLPFIVRQDPNISMNIRVMDVSGSGCMVTAKTYRNIAFRLSVIKLHTPQKTQ